MKYTSVLPLVGLATSFVIPDEVTMNRIALADKHDDDGSSSSWWDNLRSADSIFSTAGHALDSVASGIDSAVEAVERTTRKLGHKLEDAFDSLEEPSFLESSRPHHPHTSNLTIYQLISESKYTTKFAALVDEYDDIVDLLNSTKVNSTLFVPIDKAFEHVPDDKKPPREFVEKVLQYHIGLGFYPAGRILVTHTIPSALNEPWLGDRAQRLRTSVGLFGVRVNFYSKVVAANIFAKNGVVHGVDHILVPPPLVGRELSLLPSKFSTLVLAMNKSNFTQYVHEVGTNWTGSTVFAPTNFAFSKLGTKANAFLFNTEKGLGYLKALLKYHVVANQTLYSDEFYGGRHGDAAADAEALELTDVSEAAANDDVEMNGGHYHVDLPTLLGDKSIAVDIARWGGLIRIKLNGYVPVTVQDGISKNGVIQVVSSVLIPPHRHHGEDAMIQGEISVEELKERLEPYLEEEDRKKQEQEQKVIGEL